MRLMCNIAGDLFRPVHSIEEALKVLGIQIGMVERDTKSENFPRELYVIATRDGITGSFFEMGYVLQDPRSAWSDSGFTRQQAEERALKDIYDVAKKKGLIIRVD